MEEAKRGLAAGVGAAWIVPASSQMVTGSFMYPAIAGGVAYYTATRYGLVAGYAAGGLIYAIVAYNDLSDEISKIKKWW